MKEEEIQIGFAAGDKIIFNFKEIDHEQGDPESVRVKIQEKG